METYKGICSECGGLVIQQENGYVCTVCGKMKLEVVSMNEMEHRHDNGFYEKRIKDVFKKRSNN